MARKFSTALRQAILGANVSLTGTTLSVDDSGNKKLLDSGNGLAIFQPGDIIKISGFTEAAIND